MSAVEDPLLPSATDVAVEHNPIAEDEHIAKVERIHERGNVGGPLRRVMTSGDLLKCLEVLEDTEGTAQELRIDMEDLTHVSSSVGGTCTHADARAMRGSAYRPTLQLDIF